MSSSCNGAADFFDFISSIVTTFEGDDLEMCYGSHDKPKCLSDLMKMIFDTRADVSYCWSPDGADNLYDDMAFDCHKIVDAKKSASYTYYSVSAVNTPCVVDFYKMIPTAPRGYKMWTPVTIGTYPEWMKRMFSEMIRSTGGSIRDYEFTAPWINFKYNGTFCTFTFTQSGVDVDIGRIHQLYMAGGDRVKAFQDVRADISMSFPDGAEPVFGLGICEEFRVAKTVVNEYSRPIMLLNNFIIVPRQLVARLGFRKIHTLTV